MKQSVGIDAPAPTCLAAGVISFRPLFFEHGFGFSITDLLLPIRPHGAAIVVPDHGSRTESEFASVRSHPPANIDVVTRLAKLRIKSPDGFQPIAAEGHVATGNMLGFRIGKEHMSGPARRSRHTARSVSVVQARDVWPAHTRVISFEKGRSQIAQPIRIRASVVVNVGNDFAAGGLPT